MTKQDSSNKSSEVEEKNEHIILRGRRVEDELRLRELELQTNFQIKTLTESLNLLKTDFLSWRDSLNTKLEGVTKEVDGLKTRLTVVIALIVAQLIGVEAIFLRLFGV